MYSSRVYRMVKLVEEWTTCMRLLSWRRHQGTMLKNCNLILPVSDPAKQAAQVVNHHVFDERTVITSGGFRGGGAGRAPPPPPKIRKAYVIQR
jgi:hypothetical protein